MFKGVSEPIRETQRSAFLDEGLRNLINHFEKGRICFRNVSDFLGCRSNEVSEVLIRSKV